MAIPCHLTLKLHLCKGLAMQNNKKEKKSKLKWLREKLLQSKILVYATYFALTDSKAPRWLRLCVGLTVVYVLFPFDMIPDLIPGLGLVDDMAVVYAMWGTVSSRIGADHVFQARHKLDAL